LHLGDSVAGLRVNRQKSRGVNNGSWVDGRNLDLRGTVRPAAMAYRWEIYE
jgi:hypothetical protein